VRFRSKSCLFFDPDGQNQQRGLVVAIDAAKVPAGECGVENQVGRVGVYLFPGIPCDETYLRPLGL
jgi:hypothetical protein